MARLNPECKNAFFEHVLYNSNQVANNRYAKSSCNFTDFMKTVCISRSFMYISRLYSVYNLGVFAFNDKQPDIVIGKGGKIYNTDMKYLSVYPNTKFSHEQALRLIQTLNPPSVVLGLSASTITEKELEEYAKVLSVARSRLSLIFSDKECDPKFLPFIRAISRQIVFLYSDAELIANNFEPNNFCMDLFICQNVKHLGQLQRILSQNIDKLALSFEEGQYNDAIQIGGENFGSDNHGNGDENSVCNSLKHLLVKYYGDPEDLVPILDDIKEMCPNLYCIMIHADLETTHFIQELSDLSFKEITKCIDLLSSLIAFVGKYEKLRLSVEINIIFHLCPGNQFDVAVYEYLQSKDLFHNYRIEIFDTHSIHSIQLSGGTNFNLSIKMVEYKPKLTFFPYIFYRVKGFFRNIIQRFV